ncbi:MAG: hypothetical protein LBJ67_16860 [Planctomycetaceae bacterium]|jgi:hypothetical protein|nr:hypothetical protein [Planctomycetaceae bacterium]
MSQVPELPQGATFESVWAIMQENALQLQELKQQMQETDRQMQKTDKQISELSKQMGGLHNSFGELAEHLVVPSIVERFNELGYHFERACANDSDIDKQTQKTLTEIDVLLQNGTAIVAVEVKTKPKEKDISHHIERLEILRQYMIEKNDNRKIIGAIAGAVFFDEIKEATIEAGMYVITQSGDTMKIEVPQNFKPKEW